MITDKPIIYARVLQDVPPPSLVIDLILSHSSTIRACQNKSIIFNHNPPPIEKQIEHQSKCAHVSDMK